MWARFPQAHRMSAVAIDVLTVNNGFGLAEIYGYI
jgi:hypothetical protein